MLVLWLLCAISAAVIGKSKGRAGEGFVLGLFFGPFGILFALLMKGNRRTCNACRMLIDAEATICPHCRTAAEKLGSLRGEPPKNPLLRKIFW
jgi:hypothetical protein